MKQYLAIALIAILLFAKPLKTLAWGMQGHRIVGEIATGYLTSKAKKEVQTILGNESIAIASNWPDFIRSDSNYKYLSPWHYADMAQSLSWQEFQDSLKADTAVNAYNRIGFLVQQLKNKTLPQEEKVMYLRLLIHIVGDVHQPLHISRHGDRGGNDIRVIWFSDPSNLHRVWDEELVDYQKLSYTEYVKAINFVTPQQKDEWQKATTEQWLFESYEISEKLHDDVKPNEKLGYNYNFKYIATVNEQLLKAGVRLAGLLNEIFGS